MWSDEVLAEFGELPKEQNDFEWRGNENLRQQEEKMFHETNQSNQDAGDDSGNSSNRDSWDDIYYRDVKTGKVKGPFVKQQIQEWVTTSLLSEKTPISVNGGPYRALKELLRLYGIYWSFYVEDDNIPAEEDRFYWRKNTTAPINGPFSEEQMHFCNERGFFDCFTEISSDGETFIPLADYIRQAKDWEFPFGEHRSSPFNDLSKTENNFFYREADRIKKGPFNRGQMQTLYDCKAFENLEKLEIATQNGPKNFTPFIKFYINKFGTRHPFGRESTETDLEERSAEFFCFNETKFSAEGPYVKSQMQCWYERQVIHENSKIAVDPRRFTVLGELIKRNGKERPFDGDCTAPVHPGMPVDERDEYHVKCGGGFQGAHVHKQLLYWYRKGVFDSDQFKFASSQWKAFMTLKKLIVYNGTVNPFTSDGGSLYGFSHYYYRDTETSIVKGPYIVQQMQKWFEDGRFQNDEVTFSQDREGFWKLVNLGTSADKYPFLVGDNTSEKSMEQNKQNTNQEAEFFYRDLETGEIRGPYIATQMKIWYKMKHFGEGVRISSDGGKTFLALVNNYQLARKTMHYPGYKHNIPSYTIQIASHLRMCANSSLVEHGSELFGNVPSELMQLYGLQNPFRQKDSNFEICDNDVFRFRNIKTGRTVGLFVGDQMQLFYSRGMFDMSTEISQNFEEFQPLSSFVNMNGEVTPFRGRNNMFSTSPEQDQEYSRPWIVNEKNDALIDTHKLMGNAFATSKSLDLVLANNYSLKEESNEIESHEEDEDEDNESKSHEEEEESLSEEESIKPSIINWLAVCMVSLLLILNEGLFFIMWTLGHFTEDNHFSECLSHSRLLQTAVYIIIVIIIAFSSTGSLKACFTK